MHICTAPVQQLAEQELARPDIFCALRSALDSLGVHALEADGSLMQVETPFGMLQLIVPALFFVMAIRFTVRGFTKGKALFMGGGEGEQSHDELAEARRARVAELGAKAADSEADSEAVATESSESSGLTKKKKAVQTGKGGKKKRRKKGRRGPSRGGDGKGD